MRRKKSNEEEKKYTIREKLADAMDMSKEIILDTIKIVFIGNREVTIENYKGIIEYTDEVIRINATPNPLKIEGRLLEIKTITQEMLYITGSIRTVEFLKN